MLVDDPYCSFLRPNPDALDVVDGLAKFLELGMHHVGGFDSGLCVEFSRVGNFEEDVLHNVRRIWHLELKLFALWMRSC